MSLPTEHMPQDQFARICRVLHSMLGRQHEAICGEDYAEFERLLEQREGLLRRLQLANLSEQQREQSSALAQRLLDEDANCLAVLEEGLAQVRAQVRGLANQRRMSRAYIGGAPGSSDSRYLDAQA